MKPDKQYVSVFFDKAMLERIDAYRFDNRLPSRTEAIRHLIHTALEPRTAKEKNWAELVRKAEELKAKSIALAARVESTATTTPTPPTRKTRPPR